MKAISGKVDNIEGLAALYDGVIQKLVSLTEASTALEGKLAANLAGALVVVVFLVSETEQWRWLAILGLSINLISVICSLIGSYPRVYPSATVELKQYPGYIDMDSQTLLLQLIADCEKAAKKVKIINMKKARLYKISTSLFVVGTSLSLLSLFIVKN